MVKNIEDIKLVLRSGRIQDISKNNYLNQNITIKIEGCPEIYLPFTLEQKLYEQGDELDVVFSKEGELCYAVLNKSKSSFWLGYDLNSYEPRLKIKIFKKSLFFVLSFYFSFIFIILLRQVLIDMDVFWGDLWDTLFYFHLFVILGVIYYIYHEYKSFNTNLIQAIYSILKFPILTKQHLDCLNWRNSYFEVEPHLFNLKPIVNLLSKHSVEEVTEIIDKEANEKDQYGLTSFEREYMKLMKYEGQLNNIQLKKILKTEADYDPYIEVKFKIDELPIYGYIDEFSLKNEELVTVICSSFSDPLGRYFWLMTNRKDVVYLDEAQPFTHKSKLYVDFYIIVFFIIFIVIASFFIAFLDDNFWGDLVLTFLTGFFFY